MPQHTPNGMDVSAEEERYLRRAFRRFALPYVVLLMAFSWWMSWDTAADDASGALAELRTDLGVLEATVAELSASVAAADSRASQAAKLASNLGDEQGKAASESVAALKRDLKRTRGRVDALESKLGDPPVSQRFDALRDRIAGLEERLIRKAAPASDPRPPAAPAPTPIPPATP